MSSKSKETNASSQPNMADTNGARGFPREGNMVPRFRKVDSMPSSLKSKRKIDFILFPLVFYYF